MIRFTKLYINPMSIFSSPITVIKIMFFGILIAASFAAREMYNPRAWATDQEHEVGEGEQGEEVKGEEEVPVEEEDLAEEGVEPGNTKTPNTKDREIPKRRMTPIEIGWGLARGYKWAKRELEEQLKEKNGKGPKSNARGDERPVTCLDNSSLTLLICVMCIGVLYKPTDTKLIRYSGSISQGQLSH